MLPIRPFLLLILIVTGLLTARLAAQADHIFVYVDSNVPGPGSGTEADPFSTIQAAMNYVIPHDFVFVRPGVYQEAVVIPYFILMRSTEGAGKTIIDATGLPGTHAVEIGVLSELSGFTVRKGDGAGIRAAFDPQGAVPAEYGRILKGNRIENCPQGALDLEGPLHPAVSENVIVGPSSFGVRLAQGASPFFSHNTIVNCTVGLEQTGAGIDANGFLANSIIWANGLNVSGVLPSDVLNMIVGDASFHGVSGSMNLDPQFVDLATGDVRLSAASPAIDAATPVYTLSGSSYDHRGLGSWRRIDGDEDGDNGPDIGAYERGGLQVIQTGTGPGSLLEAEIVTGPQSQWYLAAGTLTDAPVFIGDPATDNPWLWLEPSNFVLLVSGTQGSSGTAVLPLGTVTPFLVGLTIPVQAVGVTAGSIRFTNLENVTIR